MNRDDMELSSEVTRRLIDGPAGRPVLARAGLVLLGALLGVLLLALLSGCGVAYVSDGEFVYLSDRKYEQQVAELDVRTPKGATLKGTVARRVDAEGLRATGAAAADVLTALGKLLTPLGLAVGPLDPGRVLPPQGADVEAIRERLKPLGLDVVSKP